MRRWPAREWAHPVRETLSGHGNGFDLDAQIDIHLEAVDFAGVQPELLAVKTAAGIGADPSFSAPMAIVVIGGLITSTFLSLLVIPVLFTFVDDVVLWTRRLTHRNAPPVASPAHAGPPGADTV